MLIFGLRGLVRMIVKLSEFPSFLDESFRKEIVKQISEFVNKNVT